VFAKKTAMVRSVQEVAEGNGMLIEHQTVAKQVGDEIPVISAKVEGASEVNLFYKIGKDVDYQTVKMDQKPEGGNIFIASLPLQPKATKAWYFLEAVSQREEGDVKLTLPEKGSGDFAPLLLKYEGEVPPMIIFLHIVCVFGAIFFSGLALLSAVDIKRGKETLKKAVKFPLATFVLLFLGFVPFGIAMNYFAFGATWEAFPFGWDVTDNKSQILLLVWLFTLFLAKGTLLGKGESRNLVSDRGFATWVMISFIVGVLIFGVPHSL
jgi:hypothetical protein